MVSGSARRKNDFPRDKNRSGQSSEPWECWLVGECDAPAGRLGGGDPVVSAVSAPVPPSLAALTPQGRAMPCGCRQNGPLSEALKSCSAAP